MRRAPLTILLAVLLALAAACGGDSDDDAADVPPAGEGAATDDEVNGSDDTVGSDATDPTDGTARTDGTEAGDGDEVAAPSVEVCEALGVDEVADASGIPVVAAGVNIGGGLYGDVEYDGRGCKYTTGDESGEVVVKLLVEPEGGAEDLFAAVRDESATSSFDDHPHEVVDGLGDGAFFAAGLRSADLWILAGDEVIFLRGEADGEPLDTATLQSVGTAAVAALG